jgi:cephalosporin hydroxylase
MTALKGRAGRIKRDWHEVVERRGGASPGAVLEVGVRGAVRWQPLQRAVGGAFHRMYYYNASRTWANTNWRGHQIRKLPLDAWMYQELITELKPALIVETGTRFGGSAVFMGDLCELIDHGQIVSIDIDADEQPEHPRVTYLDGSSTDPAVVERVRALLPAEGHVLVILDSDHRTPHVRDEIAAYADMVTPGSYLIVEDTNTGGNPVENIEVPDGGPLVAVHELLARDDRFEIDESRERFFITQNPSGYLKRLR